MENMLPFRSWPGKNRVYADRALQKVECPLFPFFYPLVLAIHTWRVRLSRNCLLSNCAKKEQWTMARERTVVVGAGGISNEWFAPLIKEKVDIAAVVDLNLKAVRAQIK